MLTDVVIANKNYTKLSVSEDQTIDQIALKVIKQDCPDFLLPIKTMEIDGEQEIRYEQQDGVRLCYSARKMYKKDFIAMLKNMLIPFKICNDWFLDYHNILLDEKYVLLGKKDNSVKYIYIPVAEYAQTDEAIEDFFSTIVLEADILDDSRYAVDLLRILKNSNSNLMTVLDYLSKGSQESQGDQAEAGQRGQNASGGSGFGRDMSQAGGLQSGYREEIHKTDETGQKAGNAWGMNRLPKEQEQEKQAAETKQKSEAVEAKRSSGGARPGQSSEFGKQDIEGKLLGNLFGDEDEGEEEKKSAKSSRHQKEKGKEKEKEKEKSAKSGGFFDKWKGKGKTEEVRQDVNAGKQNAAGGQRASKASTGHSEESFGQRGQAAFTGYMQEDLTDIAVGTDSQDDGFLRLRLVDSAGFECPRTVEIDMSRGYATVGRLDKNGQAQSDYCFDSALSFISRRHFRVEKCGDHWEIIDIGSGNGTYVNGERLVANIGRPLFSGDTIRFSGKITLAYQVC